MKYVGKQKALAFAMMAMFASGSVYAVAVDLSAASPVPVKYAKEIKFDDATPLALIQGTGADFSMTAKTGVNLNAADKRWFRFELSSGEWGANVATSGVVGTMTTASVASPNFGLSSKAFYVEVTASAASASTDLLTINMAGLPANSEVVKSTTANKLSAPVKVTMTVHGSVGDAANGTVPLTAPVTATYVTFDDSMFASADSTPGTAQKINVLKASKLFEGDFKTVELCSLSVSETGALLANGTAANASGTTIDAAAASSVLKVKGNFSAAAAGGVFLSTAGCVQAATPISGNVADGTTFSTITDTDAAKEAGTMNAAKDEVSFAIGANGLYQFVTDNAAPNATLNGTEVKVCMTVDGTTPIPAGPVTVSYEPVPAANYTAAPITFSKCNALEKNGSTFTVPLLLNSASPFLHFIRVTNPSSTTGVVNIMAYNDDGAAGSKVMTFPLKPGQSSGMISMATIATETGAATLAATNGTAGTAADKLRLQVEAEFGTGHNGSDQSGVVVRSYAMTKDRNGFSEFK